jgi:hypothetical protein
MAGYYTRLRSVRIPDCNKVGAFSRDLTNSGKIPRFIWSDIYNCQYGSNVPGRIDIDDTGELTLLD